MEADSEYTNNSFFFLFSPKNFSVMIQPVRHLFTQLIRVFRLALWILLFSCRTYLSLDSDFVCSREYYSIDSVTIILCRINGYYHDDLHYRHYRFR